MAANNSYSEIDVRGGYQTSGGNNEDALHLLMIGKPEVGKSSLAGVFINGKSGVSSPDSATTGLISTPVEGNGIRFVVHDTEGIDASLTEHMHDEMKRIASNPNCIVVVCIPFDGHAKNHMSALQTVTNLSPDREYEVWGKTIIALTKTDNVSIDRQNELYSMWKDRIIQELRNLHVSEPRIANIKICNTSDTSQSRLPSYPKNWRDDLLKKINEIIPDSGGLHDFLSSCVNPSFVDYLWQHTWQEIISFIEDNAIEIGGSGLCIVVSIANTKVRNMLIAFCAAHPLVTIGGTGMIFITAVAIAIYRLYQQYKEKHGHT